MNILIVHPGTELDSLWATARAVAEFGELHIVLSDAGSQVLIPRNLTRTHLHFPLAPSLVECVRIAITGNDLPQFDAVIVGCASVDSPATRADRQAAALVAYDAQVSALSVVVASNTGERLFENSIQFVVERLVRNVLLPDLTQSLVFDAKIPNVHPNKLSGFSLSDSVGAEASESSVLIQSLMDAHQTIQLLQNRVSKMGSRHAYEEANKVGSASLYHFKSALLSDSGRERSIPPAGGGTKIEPYEQVALRRAVGRVLDVGCGDGRIASYLMRQRDPQRIQEVVGIDTTPAALESYKARFAAEHLEPGIAYFGDILKDDWEHLGKFNTLLLCGNNFGIASNLDQVVNLLRKLRALAHSGGCLIGSSRHPLHPKTPQEEREVSYRNLSLGFELGERWLRFTYESHDSGWVQWYYLAPSDLVRAANQTGWRLDAILYGTAITGTLDFIRFEMEATSDEYGVVLTAI
jgi:SAM-dependent methyltransferase